MKLDSFEPKKLEESVKKLKEDLKILKSKESFIAKCKRWLQALIGTST